MSTTHNPGSGTSSAAIGDGKIDGRLVGRRSVPVAFTYAFRDVILYALGVGATAAELDYLYEGRGPKVLPSFAVVPSFASLIEVVAGLGANLMMVVHGEQKVRLLRPLPAAATLWTSSEIKAVYDKGKGALVVVECQINEADGKPVAVSEFSLYVRGAGGFGGPRGPEGAAGERKDHALPDGPPDFEVTEATRPEQALLYRLSGDLNPLHADPLMAQAVGFPKPILHGLCTFGFATRALVRSVCDGDGDRVRALSARFAAPVLPGDALTTRGWHLGEGTYALRVTTHSGQEVLSHALAEVVRG